MGSPYRYCVVLGLLVSAGSTPTLAQGSASDSAAVSRAHQQWFEAILAEDTVLVSAIPAPEVTLGFPGGNVMPRADFLRYMQAGELFYDSAEHGDRRIRVYGSAAVVTGRSRLGYRFRGSMGTEQLAYTATYVRSGAGWQMVAWQSTIGTP